MSLGRGGGVLRPLAFLGVVVACWTLLLPEPCAALQDEDRATLRARVGAHLRGSANDGGVALQGNSALLSSNFYATVQSAAVSGWYLYQGVSPYAQDAGALTSSTCSVSGQFVRLNFVQLPSGSYNIITPYGQYLCAPEATGMWYSSPPDTTSCAFTVTPSGNAYHISIGANGQYALRPYVDSTTGLWCMGNLAAWYGASYCNVGGQDYCAWTFS